MSKVRKHSTGHDWYSERLAAVEAKPWPTEADVSDGLVRPVLERVLGFGIAEIDAQPVSVPGSGPIRRPDFICRSGGIRRAAVIVEVKRLGADFTKRTGPSWKSAPLGQLQDYLERHRDSADGTWGVLTNGLEWIITRRVGDHVLPFERTPTVKIRTLSGLKHALAPISSQPLPPSQPLLADTDADWLEAAMECASPQDFVRRVTASQPGSHVHHGHNAAHRMVAHYTSDGELLPREIHVACLRMDFPDGPAFAP